MLVINQTVVISPEVVRARPFIERSPIASGRRTASVRAALPTRVARISRAVFEQVLRADDALHGRLAELRASQLRNDRPAGAVRRRARSGRSR